MQVRIVRALNVALVLIFDRPRNDQRNVNTESTKQV